MSPAVEMTIASFSEIGRREINEDRVLVVDSEDGTRRLLAVADGLGGQDDGEIAAQSAIDAVRDAFIESAHVLEMTALLDPLFDAAHGAVERERLARSTDNTMATTLAILVLSSEAVVWAHVGDSRIYRLRGDDIERLTRDHTAAATLLDLQERESRKRREPTSGTLLAVVGDGSRFREIGVGDAANASDTYLLCSDGLWGAVADRAMYDDARSAGDLRTWLDTLRDRVLTLDDPNQDNFTAAAISGEAWPALKRKAPGLLRRWFRP